MLKIRGVADKNSVSVKGAAQAVWSCSVSKQGRVELLKAGLLDRIGGLLASSDIQILIPTVGILHRCLVQVK